MLTSLLLHDGELADVCALMGQLGLEFTERRGSPKPEDEARGWDLVVSTPRRLLELDVGATGSQPVRIAILDKDSNTLRSMLQRAGINLIVRRPVHPAALRLLLLHSLYRGPEKRRALRVSVGAPVRYRAGLRRRSGIMADLSLTGCRLLSTHPVECGRSLRLSIPAELAGKKGFRLTGTVLRTGGSELPGVTASAIAFRKLPPKVRDRLRSTVAAHITGPAMLPEGEVLAPLSSMAEALEATPGKPAGSQAAAKPRERRRNPRRQYEQHVIALGVEAARVLIGCDISLEGMRVDSHPDLSVGDELQIALHVRVREKALVVRARVTRDDGEQGLVLQFSNLSQSSRAYLRNVINFRPILAVSGEGEEGAGIIISEILEHRAAAAVSL
ncbi:MAG: PilZ domain-containing protein [Deltaproteobacteria bacterium]|nr:PilZ domain-containing protein [Deltaproteobacteria bacterium]